VIVFGEQAPTAVVKKYAEYAPIREMGTYQVDENIDLF